jgi:gluconokinase
MRDGSGKPLFMACSALRQVYRERLSEGLPHLRFIYLKGSAELIRSRMASRENHFMPTSLLDSQFATLEEPQEAMIADISLPLTELIESIQHRIG